MEDAGGDIDRAQRFASGEGEGADAAQGIGENDLFEAVRMPECPVTDIAHMRRDRQDSLLGIGEIFEECLILNEQCHRADPL